MAPNQDLTRRIIDAAAEIQDDDDDAVTAAVLYRTLTSEAEATTTATTAPTVPTTAVPPPLRCAIVGCGMMGQEHCSYIMGYSPNQIQIKYLCDPNESSIQKCLQVLHEFSSSKNTADDKQSKLSVLPTLVYNEQELFQKHLYDIDLLVIATPNYLHTPSILQWGQYSHLTILVEKPVAVSHEQVQLLQNATSTGLIHANIWVAMEYRFIPAISKLIALQDTIGDIKMITIRENRFPFLQKVESWNRDRNKTGDTLVEKCCHFFDLMRLITKKEANLSKIRSIAQRGINYHDEAPTVGAVKNTYQNSDSGNDSDVDTSIDVPHSSALTSDSSCSSEEGYESDNNEEAFVPIIDSAYVTLPFQSKDKVKTIGCLELCMYADGSRHQEEVIITGTKGRLEAYLPENKVYAYQRPNTVNWTDRTVPPPYDSITRTVYDCSDVCSIHNIPKTNDSDNNDSSSNSSPIPTHGGYHYSSTAVEWYRLLEAVQHNTKTGVWNPLVSLQDGISAVQIGLQATESIINDDDY